MNENDSARTANESGAACALPFKPSEWLAKVATIAEKVEAAYMQGDCEFLAREGIADALESISSMTANQMANESQKCKAETNYYSAFKGICAAFECAFRDWLNFANIPGYKELIKGIRDDIRKHYIPEWGIDSNSRFCILPWAVEEYGHRDEDCPEFPFIPFPYVKDGYRIVGTAGQANMKKLIAIGRAMARAAQARKGAERIETKHAEKKARRPVSIEKMAQYAEVSKKTIVNWENGKGTPEHNGIKYHAAMRDADSLARMFGELHKGYRIENNKRIPLSVADREKAAAGLCGLMRLLHTDK